MKKILLFLIFSIYGPAQTYNSESIPENLKTNAYVVIREHLSDYQILSVDKIQIKENKVWTILGKEGDGYGQIVIPYDKSTKVSDIKISVYDKNGKETGTYSKKDFSDYSHTPSFGLYVDDRVLVLNITKTDFPFTIKSSYTVNTSNTVFIPDLFPVTSYNIAAENVVRRINNTSGIKLRSKISNTAFGNIDKKENGTSSEYTIKNFAAIKQENFAPSLDYILPKAEFSLEKFNLEGKQGDLSNWDSFGKWYYNNLLTPSTAITPEIRNEVASLNLNGGSTEEKVKKIYQYMQNKTRYVLVAMGIGGWQPMPAEEVRRKGYGDCKALTNYTRAMLDAAGIPSYYSVIKSDYSAQRFDESFPKMAGNHVILMVPDGTKKIWLENTSQHMAYNHLSYNTTNRNVLAVSEKGVNFFDTPVYGAQESQEILLSKIKLSPDGGMEAKNTYLYTGGQYDFNLSLDGLTPKEISEKLKERYPSLKLNQIEISDFNNNRSTAEISFKTNMTAANFSKRLGEDFFFRALPFNDFNMNTSDKARVLPFEIPFAFQDDYTIEYQAPMGYRFDSPPQNVEYSSEFGTYKTEYKLEKDQLVVHRILNLKKGIYPKEKYAAYLDFRKKTISSDNTKILITKQK